MQFIDLSAQQKRIRNEIEANIRKVLDHGLYIMGPEVNKLEEKLAEFINVKHAVSCASGTDALLLSLLTYNVGPGDAVFTTPFTFIATAEMISLLRATPVFVDIDPKTFNIDPDHLNKAITAINDQDPSVYSLPRALKHELPKITPKGVIAVDLFGLPCNFDHINSVAEKHGLFVIEDAAQSFGAEYKGKKACSIAEIGCTSFFPAKPFGCYGDGGMCFTDNDKLEEIMQSLRVHGKGNHKYENIRIGINGRLDTLQAAILLAKFEIFPEEVELRHKAASKYTELLIAAGNKLSAPFEPDGYKSVWAQYSVLASDEEHRTNLQTKLRDAGIPTAIYYPKPLHLQAAFTSLGYKEGDFPICEDFARRIFSLPMHPYLKKEEQEKIADIVKNPSRPSCSSW